MILTIITIYLLGVILALLITALDVYNYLMAVRSPHKFWQVVWTMVLDPHINFLFSWYFVIERLLKGS